MCSLHLTAQSAAHCSNLDGLNALQGIQDVGDFVSSVEHKWRVLTQTVAVCHSYNGSQWDPWLWERKNKTHTDKTKIKPCGSWRYIEFVKHEKNRSVQETEQYLYNCFTSDSTQCPTILSAFTSVGVTHYE